MGKQEPAERGQWGSHTEFMLSCIGYCVGLGNIWRFPYLAYRNGGGAFLIPYFIMLLLAGIPLFMLELSFGQFAGLGPVTIFRSVPIMKGIGIGMCLVSFYVVIYYNVIVAYAFHYLFASFTSTLPWGRCDQWWNKQTYCNTTIGFNETTAATTTLAPTTDPFTGSTVPKEKIVLRAEEYWNYRVLQIDKSDGIHDPGKVRWDLCLCLLLAWIVVLCCLIKGIRSSGKVVYFTATFPYLILIILLIRGCLLTGARDGIIYYVRPVWSKLKDTKVWSDAATQIFYSLGAAFGSLLTFSSYNPFRNNVLRDTLIVTFGNCLTSVFGGFVIFSVIGHLSHELNVPIENVTDSGPGLAFVIYPEALLLMPIAPFWSILFFFMLLTLGLDSQFGMVEAVLSGIDDELEANGIKGKKTIVTVVVCIVCFLLGILLVTEGGFYWFQLYDWYSAYYGLIAVAFLLVLTVGWGYGFFFTYRWRLFKDIKLMLGYEVWWYFKIAWFFVTPVTLLFLLVMSGINYTPIYLGDYVYPSWADNLGICMSVSAVAVVPIYAVIRLIYALVKGQDLTKLYKPSSTWGPQDKTIAYDPLYGETSNVGMQPYNVSRSFPDNDKPPSYHKKVDDNVIDPFPTKI